MAPAWYEVISSPVARAARPRGANSITIDRQMGIRPPSPRPARKRPAPNRPGEPATAHAAEPAENTSTPATRTGRRPSQSVRVPVPSAPISMPRVTQLPIVPATAGVRPNPGSSSICGMTAP